MEKWWEVTKVKKELEVLDLCKCKTEMKGKWKIIDQQTKERAYMCVRCGRRVYPKH